MQRRIIEKDTLIKCPECKKEDYAVVWDEATKGECFSRELKRAYTSILLEKGTRVGTKFNYKCPHCGRFISGSKLMAKKDVCN